MSVLPRGLVTLVWLGLASVPSGCGDAHWATVTWPDPNPEAPSQPVLESTEIGLAVRATKVAYEPDGIRVTLTAANTGAGRLRLDPTLIMLSWDALEYAPETKDIALELGPGEEVELELYYELGRPLITSSSRLLFRAVQLDGVAVVNLPELTLPAIPM